MIFPLAFFPSGFEKRGNHVCLLSHRFSEFIVGITKRFNSSHNCFKPRVAGLNASCCYMMFCCYQNASLGVDPAPSTFRAACYSNTPSALFDSTQHPWYPRCNGLSALARDSGKSRTHISDLAEPLSPNNLSHICSKSRATGVAY